jgi:hypothetical protein
MDGFIKPKTVRVLSDAKGVLDEGPEVCLTSISEEFSLCIEVPG